MKNHGVVALLLCACACGAVAHPVPPAGPTPLPTTELRYRLIDTVGRPVTCGLAPTWMIPVADVKRMVAELRASDPAEFDAIVRREHLDAARLTEADDLRILGQASLLAAVKLTPQGSGYGFDYEVASSPPVEVAGTIDAAGAVRVASRAPAPRRFCPL